MSSEAIQSFIQVLIISGTAGILTLLVSYVRRFNSEDRKKKGKPIILAASIFILSIILVVQINLLPIAAFRGPNTTVSSIYETRTFQYTVYGGELYTEYIEVTASVYLDALESVDVLVEFIHGDSVNASTTLHLALGMSESRVVSYETFLDVAPDLYDIRLSYRTFYNGSLSERMMTISVVLGQDVMSGHLEELVIWDTMRFMLIVICILTFITAVIIDTETGERRRYKWYHRGHRDNQR
ncbi:MAG: hypothetical protein RTU92_12825 [Candidatus Thorarchaeota archaeon]